MHLLSIFHLTFPFILLDWFRSIYMQLYFRVSISTIIKMRDIYTGVSITTDPREKINSIETIRLFRLHEKGIIPILVIMPLILNVKH